MITAHINIFFSKSKVKNALPGKKNGLTPLKHGKIANEHNKLRVPEIFVCVFWASKKWDINPWKAKIPKQTYICLLEIMYLSRPGKEKINSIPPWAVVLFVHAASPWFVFACPVKITVQKKKERNPYIFENLLNAPFFVSVLSWFRDTSPSPTHGSRYGYPFAERGRMQIRYQITIKLRACFGNAWTKRFGSVLLFFFSSLLRCSVTAGRGRQRQAEAGIAWQRGLLGAFVCRTAYE